jgi:diaminopimelate decarboxylase
MGCEVMTPYELELALRLGCPPARIIVNGPAKTMAFLMACVRAGVRLIIADSIEELRDLEETAAACGTTVEVLFRVNPDVVPKGMNRGTATGSRKGCAFGLDLVGGELPVAFRLLGSLPHIRFAGVQMHIGTGIRKACEYRRALRRLGKIRAAADEHGARIRVVDVGGGFGSPTAREFGTMEFLVFQAMDRLPGRDEAPLADTIPEFIGEIARSVRDIFGDEDPPELLYEPGRCIASGNQFLLLTALHTKERPGAGRWIVLDGGLSTVTLPTYYEHHDVILCNDLRRPLEQRATLIGPACFAGDVIYKNKMMPRVHRGDVLALMDAGAYFTALESSFGFPRPAIVAVSGAECRLVRTRETFEEMTGRDIADMRLADTIVRA